MPNIIHLTIAEAKFFAQQDEITILRVLKEQPPDDKDVNFCTERNVLDVGNLVFKKATYSRFDIDYSIPLRYPSGKYAVKETWKLSGWTEEESVCIEYKSGGFKWIDYGEDKCDEFEDAWISVCDELRKLNFPIGDDDMYHFTKENPNPLPWRSPVTMPAEAIRWHIEVETTVEKRDDGLWYEVIKGRKI